MSKSTKSVESVPATPKAKKGKKGRDQAGTIVVTSRSTSNGGNKITVAGLSGCKILKWMGFNKWEVSEAEKVLAKLFPQTPPSPSTVRCQLYSGRALAEGRTPTHTGKPAELTKEHEGELEALRELVRAETKTKQ